MDWKQLSRTTLVLPSHRAGLVLKEELLRLQQERHAQAVWAPSVQTLTQLQDALSPLYAEDELFTIIRLYKIYRKSLIANRESLIDSMPLDLFLGFGRQMLADFTNIDASMPASEVPNFFANTIAAHELSTWHLDPETEDRLRKLVSPVTRNPSPVTPDSVKSQYEILWRQLYEFYKALRTEMEVEQKGYAGMRQRAVIEHWEDDSIQTQIAGRSYIFVGFNYLLPVERELMELLRDAGQAQFYWDYVPDFTTNTKAFSFAQLNHSLLGGMNIQPPLNIKHSTLNIIKCSSREAQAQYVHRWLQSNYTAKGQKVGVVICDETMLEPVIYTLPAITLPGEDAPTPINITKGFPLRNTAVYANVLAWLADSARGKADDLVEPELIDRLIEAVLSSQDDLPLSTFDFRLSTLSWKELLILESEYQVRKLANQLRQIMTDGVGVPFTLRLLRLLFRRMMEAVTMPFHGEPVTDVQVMGVLETRLLDFDRLLLLNVEEGVLPQHQNDSSFIPYYLRKAYHMQTPDERATVYAYNFFRLIHRTAQATILYADAGTSDSAKGMSRFVMQILYSPAFTITRSTLQEASTLSPVTRNPYPVTLTASLLSTLTKDERGILRKSDGHRFRLSPSALNTFISCPRSFYLQYILGLQPQEPEEVIFEAATMGSFVHHAMEFIYRTYLHCDNTHPVRITPDAIDAILSDETKLQTALLAAYDAMNQELETRKSIIDNRYIPDNHVSENVIIKGYLRNILERDREDAKVGLQMLLLEQDRSFPVILDGIGEILTGGIIDRLDIYGPEGHEHLRVVDYKSGSYSDTTHAKRMSSTWEELMESEEKGYVRQTLIYSHAVLQHGTQGLPVEPNLYFCRRRLTDIVTTIDIQNETVHDYASIRQPFYEALCTKMAEVLTTTDFPQCEEDKCPTFCPFFDLCGRKKTEIIVP